MDERKTANEAFSELREQNELLSAQLKQCEVKIELLNEELAETNKGVVALYSELDEKALQLQEATELKSRFLSYMSHEFKTPLGSIRSITRILLDKMDGPLTSEQEKQVNFVQASAVELSEMVADLLDLAKIEAGRVVISPAWFEMVDLFAALRGMFKPFLTTSAVTLTFEEPADLPKIYTDDKKLSQILRNYISNSMKFTSQGEIRVSATRSGENNVTFSVADTGIGIAPENHAAIFHDFIQVDSPVQKKWRGTGLGLSLSKKNAELLGGTVAMESQPGKGSTFSVTIPIHFIGDAAAAEVAKPTVGQMP